MIAIAYTLLFCFLGAQMIRWLMPEKPARSGVAGRFAGRADGDGASGALRQRAGFHRRRAPIAAAGGALLCRAGKSAALRHAGDGQAAAGLAAGFLGC